MSQKEQKSSMNGAKRKPPRPLRAFALTLICLIVITLPMLGCRGKTRNTGHRKKLAQSGSYRAEQQTRASRLPKNRTQRGMVVDDWGHFITGATIEARLITDKLSAKATTTTKSDAKGAYQLSALADQDYELSVKAPGYATLARTFRPSSTPLRLALSKPGAIILTINGFQEGQKVIVAGSGLAQPRTTQPHQNTVTLNDLPAGAYEVQVQGSQVASPVSDALIVDPGKITSVTLSVEPAHTLTLTIVDALSAQPITNAKATLISGSLGFIQIRAQSNATGGTTVGPLLSRHYNARIDAAGYCTRSLTLDAGHNAQSSTNSIKLFATARAQGKVIDAVTKKPVEGAEFEVVYLSVDPRVADNDSWQAKTKKNSRALAGRVIAEAYPAFRQLLVTNGPIPPIRHAYTLTQISNEVHQKALAKSDPSGTFFLNDIMPGQFFLRVRHPRYATALSPTWHLQPTQTQANIALALQKGGRIVGDVSDQSAKKMSGVWISVIAPNEAEPRLVSTNNAGWFSVEGLLGKVRLEVVSLGHQGIPSDVDVASGKEAHVSLQLPYALQNVQGQVLDANRRPLPNVEVSIRTFPQGFTLRDRTDNNGMFHAYNLPAPPYELNLHKDGVASLQIPKWTPLSTANIFTLGLGIPINGRVFDHFRNTAVKGAHVELKDTLGHVSRSAISDPQGRFHIDGVLLGSYTLKISAQHLATHEEKLSVSAQNKTLTLADITLKRAGALLGVVLDSLGQPVHQATVTGPGESSTRTNTKGEFVLDGLPEGQHMIWASHKLAGKASTTGPVRVREGEDTPNVIIHLPARATE